MVANPRTLPDPDAYDWMEFAADLHRRGRRPAEAEAAYRRAIAGGYTDAWRHVGLLISGRRGRGQDEEAAYRAAMSSDHDGIASWAALRLGNLLDKLRGDLPEARSCFEVARDRGTGVTRQHAQKNLGLLLAHRTRSGLRRFYVAEYRIGRASRPLRAALFGVRS